MSSSLDSSSSEISSENTYFSERQEIDYKNAYNDLIQIGAFDEIYSTWRTEFIENTLCMLKKVHRSEWGAWYKKKLMQSENASYWNFKEGIDY